MTLGNAPLLATRRDARLFVDRADELARLHDAAERSLNVLLVGPPGIGKTSLLNRFVGDLEDKASEATAGKADVLLPVRVSGRPDKLLRLPPQSQRSPARRRRPARRPCPSDRPGEHSARQVALRGPPDRHRFRRQPRFDDRLLQHLESIRSLADDLRRPATGRSSWWISSTSRRSPTTSSAGCVTSSDARGAWLVAGRPEEIVILRTPPADAFFEMKVELRPLTPDASAELVKVRLKAARRPALSDPNWSPS